MGSLDGRHEIATWGQCRNLATTAAEAKVTLVPMPEGNLPRMFLVVCSQDVRLRQGTSVVTADGNDGLLYKKTYTKMTVKDIKQNTLSYIRDTADGTLMIIRIDSEDPGTGASS